MDHSAFTFDWNAFLQVLFTALAAYFGGRKGANGGGR